jgi:hypothetical protein
MVNSPRPVPCTWWDHTGHLVLYLRRYHSGDPTLCPVSGYHNAAAYCGGIDRPPEDVQWSTVPALQVETYADDERWPTRCACGYEFTPDDAWQVFTDNVMRGADGETRPQRELPVGAMFDAAWYGDKGPDGISLVVICPPRVECTNWWHVDGAAYSGGKTTHKAPAWSRTGDPRDPPTLTCSPSIEIGFVGPGKTQTPCYYHGHLQSGVLTPG